MKSFSKYLLVLLIGIILLTGCSKKEEAAKTTTCKRITTLSDNIKMDLKYTITYNKKEYVTKVYSIETVTSDNTSVLNSYKTQVEKVYEPYKDIKYYDYDVRIENKKLISEVTIQYDKIDTDKMIKIDSANSNLIKDGKVKLDDIKTYYTSMGITCE